jgi:hypothetical protein
MQRQQRRQRGGYINAYTSTKLPKYKSKTSKSSRQRSKARRSTVRRGKFVPANIAKREVMTV